MDDPFAPESRKPALRRGPLIVLGLVVLILGGLGLRFGAVLLGDWLGGLFDAPSPVAFELAERHSAALFTYEDLTLVDPALAPPNGATRVRGQDELGGWYINYSAGDMVSVGVAVSCALTVDDSASAAQQQWERWASMAGFGEGRRVHPAFSLRTLDFDWGDQAACAILSLDNEPVGNSLLVRDGKRVFWIEWRGIALETSERVSALVESSLVALSQLAR